jgi:hypothetical protein
MVITATNAVKAGRRRTHGRPLPAEHRGSIDVRDSRLRRASRPMRGVRG